MKYLVILILMVLVGCQDESVNYSDEVRELAEDLKSDCENSTYTDEDYLGFVMDETCDGEITSVYPIILQQYNVCGAECPLDGVPNGCSMIGTDCY